MKSKPSAYLETRRISSPRLYSNASYGNNGAFEIIDGKGTPLLVIASDKMGWEHVSVSILNSKRTPTWEEMDFIKRLFWEDTETVMQLHVPRDQHVNNKEGCLHMWRPIRTEIALPPMFMVGIKKLGVLA